MRSIGETAFSLPDSHTMKGYFTTRLQNNLRWYANNYKAGNANISPLGSTDYNGRVGPWQDDFVTLVFSWLAENQESDAKTYLNWHTKFTVGRFTSESAGFCKAKAAGYYWNLKDSDGSWINSWKKLYDIAYPDLVNTPCETLPFVDNGCAMCYVANANAMLAATANAGIPNAVAAFNDMKPRYPLINKALLQDPTWAIVPR
jgi:hypothetical protein